MSPHSSLKYVNRSSVEIHTQEAIELCKGKTVTTRKSKRVFHLPNVFAFGTKLNRIWEQAREDNPYAEYTLIQIENKLDLAFQKLELFDKILQRKKRQWRTPEGLTIVDCEAVNPERLMLNNQIFNTPHAKLLLVLVAKFDALMRRLKSCRQFNIIPNRRYHTIKRRAMRAVRISMYEARVYRSVKVTRRDIFNHTDLGIAAVNQLGIVSLAILKRHTRSKYGPNPTSNPIKN